MSRVQGAAGLTLPDALLRLGSRALMGPPRARQGPAPLVVAPSRSRETLVRESGTPSPCPSPGRSGVSPAGGGGWSHAGSVSRGKAGASPLRPFLSLVSGMALRCLTPRPRRDGQDVPVALSTTLRWVHAVGRLADDAVPLRDRWCRSNPFEKDRQVHARLEPGIHGAFRDWWSLLGVSELLGDLRSELTHKEDSLLREAPHLGRALGVLFGRKVFRW